MSNNKHKEMYPPIVEDLYKWVTASPSRHREFDEAIKTSKSQRVQEMDGIASLSDWFLHLKALLSWAPYENTDGNEAFNRYCVVYFILSQPSVYHYQNPIKPNACRSFSFVTDWIMRYNAEAKKFMDTPASLSPGALATFEACPAHCYNEYLPPPGGWRTFNEYFSRHVRPEYRPIAAPADPHIVASPTDFRYLGKMDICASSSSTVTAKGIAWEIRELLDDSPYAEKFGGGAWIHGSLTTSDYHRVHAPVAGTVLQATEISGTHWAVIEPHELPRRDDAGSEEDEEEDEAAPVRKLRRRRIFSYPNDLGYQFQQIRGLVVLDTAFGKVAVLPVGMGTVGSVVVSVKEGAELAKGDEIGYFQFGGSDVVVLFEPGCKFEATATNGTHYKMGKMLGRVG